MKLRKLNIAAAALTFSFAVIAFTVSSCHSGTSKKSGADTTVAKTDTTAKVNSNGIVSEQEDPNKQYVFLTFDDGPQPPGTKNVLDLCRELGVKASFFMVSDNEMANVRSGVIDPERVPLVDSIRNAYPQLLLCNHSTSHAFNGKYSFFYNHPDSALQDFLKAQQFLNVRYKIIRLPGNSAWVRQGEVFSTKQCRPVCKLLDSCGYNVIGWDVEWSLSKGHGQQHPVESADKILSMIDHAVNNYTHTKNNVVLLTHDRLFAEPASVDSLRKVILALKNNPHYVLQTIDKYPRLKTQ
jgi:peptidoglycan/xylan/chitin deacetylase (PgdA/CDA1 family)